MFILKSFGLIGNPWWTSEGPESPTTYTVNACFITTKAAEISSDLVAKLCMDTAPRRSAFLRYTQTKQHAKVLFRDFVVLLLKLRKVSQKKYSTVNKQPNYTVVKPFLSSMTTRTSEKSRISRVNFFRMYSSRNCTCIIWLLLALRLRMLWMTEPFQWCVSTEVVVANLEDRCAAREVFQETVWSLSSGEFLHIGWKTACQEYLWALADCYCYFWFYLLLHVFFPLSSIISTINVDVSYVFVMAVNDLLSLSLSFFSISLSLSLSLSLFLYIWLSVFLSVCPVK